ncbi:ethanolamine utilization protein EutJ [Clostridium sp.]|uniref:ethanolamine utilization protein EutJ n=1 Tax=Clostridium sp. TaxID=1506 RepID=UPI003A5C04B3
MDGKGFTVQSENMFHEANEFIKRMENAIYNPVKDYKDGELKVGVDLGTCNIVLTVLDKDNNPVAGEIKRANVVRDGIVVDYLKAVKIVRELKEKLEKKLNRNLDYAAAAIPPGVIQGSVRIIENVLEASDFNVTAIVDEPTAAARVLKVKDGAVVDIGGGTTGISILKDGEVIYSADEATGGHHLSLVISGSLDMEYEEAEKFKIDPKNVKTVVPLIEPVIEKIGNIIAHNIKEYDVQEIYIVGGTSSIQGIENIIQRYTGIKTVKPYNPMLVTPIGIAMSSIR